MTVEDSITTGVAQLLHAAGVATWRPDTPYQDGEVAITIAALPPSPAQAVALTVYGSQDDPHFADSTVMLQAVIRGTTDPRSPDTVAAGIAELLHGRSGFTLGDVHVIEAHRQSWSRLGRDENNRWLRSENYYLQAHTPTAHRQF